MTRNKPHYKAKRVGEWNQLDLSPCMDVNENGLIFQIYIINERNDKFISTFINKYRWLTSNGNIYEYKLE